MKKFFMLLSAVGLMTFATVNVYAQDEPAAADATEQVTEEVAVEAEVPAINEETAVEGEPFHQAVKQKFMEGGVLWMTPVLLCLVIGLAIAIERILYLSFSKINTKKFISKVETALNEGGVEAAKEICRNTKGPVASIFYQGLERFNEGLDVVEKAVASYGSVQMGLMESGLSWISLFIALSPMLGFMGTVVGMVGAFDAIQAAGDVSPTLVAGGIKVALLTTLAGLIAAVILQIFYNYILNKIDALVIELEDSSIVLVDILTAYSKK
ncbi:MAG: MotA/TolQ/ExbB proton channel family protein [Tidjanibacter sp.]|nr:MotA/TolQ/ExbB proton channel family protein [Tidjanibacter sp.]